MARTTVDINTELLEEAKEIMGVKTTKDVVNGALEALVRSKHMADLAREFIGSGVVELSDEQLDEMRRDEAWGSD
ncbi:MAG: type II toxin-antitoxin system VapB family antitoxin [Actinomycetota bacterium]